MGLRERFEVIYDNEISPYGYILQKQRDSCIDEFLEAICIAQEEEITDQKTVHSMGLPERFEQIINEGIPYIGDAHEAPLFIGRDKLKKQLLEAVCAYRGDHDWPLEELENIYHDPDDPPIWVITGPCKVCGAKEEEP